MKLMNTASRPSLTPASIGTFAVIALFTNALTATIVVDLGFEVGASPNVAPARTADIDSASEYTWNWDAGNLFFDGTNAWSQDIHAGISYTTYGGTATFGGSTGSLTEIVDGGVDATNDRIRAQAAGTTGGTGDSGSQVNLLYLWDSANFLQTAASFSFDATANSSLSSSILNVQLPWVDGRATESHFVIRDGSTYYISNESAGKVGGDAVTISGDTVGLQWAEFDPSSFSGFNGDSANVTTGGFSSQTFSDVTGVGIIAYAFRPNNAGVVFDLNGFQADLVSVPEPSAFAILFGFGALAMVLYRRRRLS